MSHMTRAPYGSDNVLDDPALFYDDFDVERFLQDLESRDRRAPPRLRMDRERDERASRERRTASRRRT